MWSSALLIHVFHPAVLCVFLILILRFGPVFSLLRLHSSMSSHSVSVFRCPPIQTFNFFPRACFLILCFSRLIFLAMRPHLIFFFLNSQEIMLCFLWSDLQTPIIMFDFPRFFLLSRIIHDSSSQRSLLVAVFAGISCSFLFFLLTLGLGDRPVPKCLTFSGADVCPVIWIFFAYASCHKVSSNRELFTDLRSFLCLMVLVVFVFCTWAFYAAPSSFISFPLFPSCEHVLCVLLLQYC